MPGTAAWCGAVADHGAGMSAAGLSEKDCAFLYKHTTAAVVGAVSRAGGGAAPPAATAGTDTLDPESGRPGAAASSQSAALF